MSMESFGDRILPGAIRRWWRLLRPGSNPLARSGDRIQARVLLILGLLALLAIPFAASLGSQSYAERIEHVQREARTKHTATAELLADAPVRVTARDVDTVQVPAQWELADGAVRTGEVSVQRGTSKGSEISIWLDESGQLTSAPVTKAGAVTDAVAIGLFAWVAVLILCGLIFGAVHAILMRRHSLRWAQQWARVEREWSRR